MPVAGHDYDAFGAAGGASAAVHLRGSTHVGIAGFGVEPGVPMAVGHPPAASSAPYSFVKDLEGLVGVFLQPINILLVFVPIGVASHYLEWRSAAIFTCNFIAIVPLAAILGSATESLAGHTGEMIGGLLNATFGNAVEMIVTIQAIRSGLIDIVQGSLLGSVLSNLLLVLGMAFFVAGMNVKESRFNKTGASAVSTCLVLGAISLALPSIYHHVPGTTEASVLLISRLSSIVIAVCYISFLVFQLHTHASYFTGEGGEDEEEPPMSAAASMALLFATTVVVAYSSEFLVDSIEDVSEEYGIRKAFIGVIMLPIVGNAAEHATAVTMAAKGKMDLVLGVAVGSSAQIVLLVVPFAVVAGWIMDSPMTLDFHMFDMMVLLLSVLITSLVLSDGASNWLEGVMLMATYGLIAIICWYMPDKF